MDLGALHRLEPGGVPSWCKTALVRWYRCGEFRSAEKNLIKSRCGQFLAGGKRATEKDRKTELIHFRSEKLSFFIRVLIDFLKKIRKKKTCKKAAVREARAAFFSAQRRVSEERGKF